MGVKYLRRDKFTVTGTPFAIKGANIKLWCDVFPSTDSHRDYYLVFHMMNDFDSTEACSISTIYIYNAGDIKITELGALIDHNWKIPLKGAREGESSRFVSTLKSGIVRAAVTLQTTDGSATQNQEKLEKFLSLALECCQTELYYMDQTGKYFQVGEPSRFGTFMKELISKKAPTSIGNRINKVISASETTGMLAPGDQFIFAAVRLNPKDDSIEFTNDLRPIYGGKDYQAYDNLLLSETDYLTKNAVTDEQTKEKKYNKLYTAATDLLKYNLIKHGITTAGDVGRAIAES